MNTEMGGLYVGTNLPSIGDAGNKTPNPVTVDPAKIVDAGGNAIDLTNTAAVRRWLMETYRDREVKILDDGQTVRFTLKGLKDDLKMPKRKGLAQRQAYAGLNDIVMNSVFHNYEPGDARHLNIDKHKTYYGVADIGGQLYGTRLKVDVRHGVSLGQYKDLAVREIKSPPRNAGGSREGHRTNSLRGDKIKVSEVVLAFRHYL